MAAATLAFLAGLCSVFGFAGAPTPAQCALCATASMPGLFSRRLRWLSAFALGFAWAGVQAHRIAADALPPAMIVGDIDVRGEVVGLPEHRNDGSSRFTFRIDGWRGAARRNWQALHRTLLLNAYVGAPRVGAAQRWELRVRLKPRRGLANPGGFDFERWLFAQRVAGTGYVRGGTPLTPSLAPSRHRVALWRERIAQWIDRHLDAADSGLIKALAIGDRSGITARDWQRLRATGTSHLVAISGLHIGLVAGIVYLVVRRLHARIPWPATLPASAVAGWAGLLAAGGYAVLAGMTLPTQRALITVAVFMSGRILARRGSPLRTFEIALCLTLIHDPIAVLSDGFWLSFGAVGCILLVSGARFGAPARWRRAASVQLGLALGLLPVTTACFQQVPLFGPLANSVAVPWVGLLAVPLILASLSIAPVLPALAAHGLTLAATLLKALMALLGTLAELPQSQWSNAITSNWQLSMLGAGVLLLLAPRGLPTRLPGAVLALSVTLRVPPAPAPGDAWATLLDVGQGLAAVVRTHAHSLVFDAGPRFPSGLDTGAAVVLPYLLGEGVRRIDTLVISHDDIDHIGGARALFRALDVRRIVSGTPQSIDWARSARCRAGDHWRWDGVAFEFIAPLEATSGNNASCVLKVTTDRGQSLLLTGDIEAPIERHLVAANGAALHAATLVAPHHGSRTSSTPAFIEAVRPRLVLFPAGYANRFGFPKPGILSRYVARGAMALVTGEEGAIRVRLNSGRVERFRLGRPRIWRAPPAR